MSLASIVFNAVLSTLPVVARAVTLWPPPQRGPCHKQAAFSSVAKVIQPNRYSAPVRKPLPERLGFFNLVEGNGGLHSAMLDVPCPLQLRPLPCKSSGQAQPPLSVSYQLFGLCDFHAPQSTTYDPVAPSFASLAGLSIIAG